MNDSVYVNASTVRRLIKAVRSDDPPIRVTGAAEQQAALTALRTELLALRLSVEKFRWEYEKRSGLTMSFDSNYVYIFFQDDLLVLSANIHDEFVPCTGAAQIARLNQLVQDYRVHATGEKLKRGKIRKLKETAIERTVKLLSEELDFRYTLYPMARQVRLSIEVSSTRALVLDIPYRNIHPALDVLRSMIPLARSLCAHPVDFSLVERS